MKILMAGTRAVQGDSNSLGDDHVYQLCFEVPARGVICEDISQGHPDDFVRENITTIDKDVTQHTASIILAVGGPYRSITKLREGFKKSFPNNSKLQIFFHTSWTCFYDSLTLYLSGQYNYNNWLTCDEAASL